MHQYGLISGLPGPLFHQLSVVNLLYTELSLPAWSNSTQLNSTPRQHRHTSAVLVNVLAWDPFNIAWLRMSILPLTVVV